MLEKFPGIRKTIEDFLDRKITEAEFHFSRKEEGKTPDELQKELFKIENTRVMLGQNATSEDLAELKQREEEINKKLQKDKKDVEEIS